MIFYFQDVEWEAALHYLLICVIIMWKHLLFLKIRQGTFREVQFPPLSILPWSPHQKETIVFAYGFKKKQWQNKLKAKTRIFLSFPAHEALCYKHSLWVAVFTELHPGDDSVSGQRSSSFHFAKGSTVWMCRSSFRLTPKWALLLGGRPLLI